MAQQKNPFENIDFDGIDFVKIARKWIIRIAILSLIGSVLLYFLDPGLLNSLFFTFLVWRLPFFILFILFLVLVIFIIKQYAKTKRNRVGVFAVLTFFLFGVIMILFEKIHNYAIYTNFASEVTALEDYLPVDREVIRYTPRIVAYNQMESTVRARTETVLWSHCRPYLEADNFGYVAAITPDGLRPTYFKKNPGFIKYDDSYQASQVISRIEQPYEVGEEMQYTDNIFRQLFFHDFFAKYPRIHYMTLGDDDKFYAIAPKIKYKYTFPFFFVPYWAGTAVIDDQGNIKSYSREELKNDPRFKGKWLAPLALFRKYVEVQDYKVGFWNTYTSVDGMLEVPELPNNTYPLVMYSESGDTYLVIDTEPQGTGRGLYKVFYQNAQTGEIFSYAPPSNEPIIGPRGAMSKVYSIKGYQWYTSSGDASSGNMLVLEPVYLTKKRGDKQVLYWKFSITSLNRTRVSATVVVEATEGGEMFEFTERAEYEAWLNDTKIKENNLDADSEGKEGNENLEARLENVESLLREALLELDNIKNMKRDTSSTK